MVGKVLVMVLTAEFFQILHAAPHPYGLAISYPSGL